MTDSTNYALPNFSLFNMNDKTSLSGWQETMRLARKHLDKLEIFQTMVQLKKALDEANCQAVVLFNDDNDRADGVVLNENGTWETLCDSGNDDVFSDVLVDIKADMGENSLIDILSNIWIDSALDIGPQVESAGREARIICKDTIDLLFERLASGTINQLDWDTFPDEVKAFKQSKQLEAVLVGENAPKTTRARI